MERGLTILFVLGLVVTAFPQMAISQPADRRMSRQEYIDTYKDQALKEMHRSKIPASITLAQGILESADGNSPLAKYANNHFGIKCHTGWTGQTFIMDDDARNECFRKYRDVYESYHDHSEFLATRSRYSDLFTLKLTDYKGWARGLKKAGYATNPKYADILIGLIEKYELHRYDDIKKMPKQPAVAEVEHTDKLDYNHRTINLQNKVKYTVVREDDSFYKIAKELNMGLWQLYKYNDLERGDELNAGQILYLQPKRNKGTAETHVFKKRDTMWAISQMYGIKLKKLYKRNNMEKGEVPKFGTTLYLRKNK